MMLDANGHLGRVEEAKAHTCSLVDFKKLFREIWRAVYFKDMDAKHEWFLFPQQGDARRRKLSLEDVRLQSTAGMSRRAYGPASAAGELGEEAVTAWLGKIGFGYTEHPLGAYTSVDLEIQYMLDNKLHAKWVQIKVG
jgi:hypothetical protein